MIASNLFEFLFSIKSLNGNKRNTLVIKNSKFSNYVRARSARNVITILWIKSEEDLILSFPTLTRETESRAQSEMIRETENLQPMELGIKNKYIRWSKAFF